MRNFIVILAAILLLAGAYGCSPASMAVQVGSYAASSAVNEAASSGESEEGGLLNRFEAPVDQFGGGFKQIDESDRYYVVYNDKGADGCEKAWREFIATEMDISEYEVLEKRTKDTYPGFPAQQTEGIIKLSKPKDIENEIN